MTELSTSHQLFYVTESDIPLWQVSEALAALDLLVKRTPAILESLFDGVTIDDVELFLTKLEAGSLKENFIVRFIFGSQDELDGLVDRTRERLGMDKLSDNGQLLTAIVLVLVLFGGGYAVSKILGKTDASIRIEANNNTIINFGAEAAGMDPADFRSIIEAAVSDEKALANEAIRILRPAKQGSGGHLEADGERRLEISRETIAAIPSEIFPDEPEEVFDNYEDVEIEIRATDLDSLKRGWGVRIPSISDKRITMQIDSLIDISSLLPGAKIRGDVTVISRLKADGLRVPRRVFLQAIHSEASDSVETGRE